MPKQKQSDSHSQYLYIRNSKSVAKCAVLLVKYNWKKNPPPKNSTSVNTGGEKTRPEENFSIFDKQIFPPSCVVDFSVCLSVLLAQPKTSRGGDMRTDWQQRNHLKNRAVHVHRLAHLHAELHRPLPLGLQEKTQHVANHSGWSVRRELRL